MIFDHMDEGMHDNGETMMDWNTTMWFYMILFFIIFILIVIILIYILHRSTRSLEVQPKNHDRQNPQSIKTDHLNTTRSKGAYFCPRCGEKLDDESLKVCPYCGSEI
ncbi:MAG: zinc ribbon domain-containing protein [Promethearchaeota archaeon]|nr:MAG: zinc ribbon domain-containing protein [Candidatus Lokiarchaeota archaeon]